MTDPLNDQLDKLLDTFDQQKQAQKEAQESTKRHEDVFLSEFLNFRTSIAYPLFERVGNQLRSHGHDFEILQKTNEVDQDVDVCITPSAMTCITLIVYPNGAGDEHLSCARDLYPFFIILASLENQDIVLGSSTTMPLMLGHEGIRGDLKLNQHSSEIIERELMKFLGEVFAS